MNAAITVAAKTHCGRVRPINEDSYLVPEGDSLALVADGMGGHRAGEVASSMAAEAIRLSARKAAEGTSRSRPPSPGCARPTAPSTAPQTRT